MGGGKTQTSTQQVQIPPEVLARYNAVNARSETVAEQPFQQYSGDPNAFVAPMTATQQAAAYNTNQAAGAAQPYYQSATDVAQQSYGAGQPTLQQGIQGIAGASQASQPYYGQAQQQLASGLGQGAAANQFAAQSLAGAQGAAGPLQGQAQQNISAAQAGGASSSEAARQAYGQGVDVMQPYMQAATQGLNAAQTGVMPANVAAFMSALSAQGAASPYYQQATAGTQGALSAASPLNQAAQQFALQGSQAISPGQLQTGQYMNPYTQNVVGATQRAMGQQFGQQQSQQQADAIKAGAFGGDRAGIQRAILQGQQGLAQSQAISPLYQQAYSQALQTGQQQQGVGLSAEQANRAAQQAAGQQLAALGQQQYGQQLGAAQQTAGLGQALYGQGITGAQTLSGLGQTQFGQGLSASQQQAALGQQGLQAGMGYGQAIQGLGQQQFTQGVGTAQQQAALANQMYGQGITGAQTAANLGQTAFGQEATAAQQLTGLGQQQYQQGLGTGQALVGAGAQEAGLGQQQANLLASLGTGAQQAALSGAQAQMGAGTAEQQTQQAGLQALYNQFQQERAYPFQLSQFLSNIAMGTGSLSGSTTTTTSPAGAFSDERLKENMRPVGKTKDGQTIYSFNYKGEKRTQIGLSAQEVAKKHPEAVGKAKVPGLGGAEALTVDYKKATADAAKKADGGGLSPIQIAAPAGLRGIPIASPLQGLGAFASPDFAGPNMITGDIPIQAGAFAPQRAPKAEGYSLGTPESWQAELASLYSDRPLESGEQYGQMRRQQLTDKLAGNDMAPMVITPPQPPSIEEPVWSDNWARGGYVDRPGYYGTGGRPERARGGMTDATWQAILSAVGAPIEVYGGKSPAGMGGGTPGSGGGYGSMAKNPVAISKLATAARMPSPAPSGFAQAAATGQSLANLYKAGKGIGQDMGLIKGTPTPAPNTGQNSNADKPATGARETNAPPSVAQASLGDIFNAPTNDAQIDLGDSERAIELAKMPDDLGSFGLDGMSESPFFAARGGRTGYSLVGGVPYKDKGNFDPSEGPRAPNGEGEFSDLLGSVIDSGASQPKGRPVAPQSARPQGGDSGIGGLPKLAKAGKSMYDAGSKAASGLGKLTGTAAEAGAPPQLAGATLANEGATGLGGVLAADLPALGAAETGGVGLGALGGEAAGAAGAALGAEAAGAAGAAGAALGAEALGATAAAVAPAALGATAAAAAPTAIAAGGEALLAMLPLLLSDRRSKHDDEVVGHLFDGQPVHTFKYNNGDNRTRMGMMTDESDRSAVHNIGGLEMLDYKRATDVATGLAPRQAAQTGGLQRNPGGVSDEELAIRTIAAETSRTGNEDEARAIANVIANRQKSGAYGPSLSDVVLAKSQFSPWNEGSNNDPMKLSPDDPRMVLAKSAFAKRGEDITGGAQNFYHLDGMKGQKPPGWAAGKESENFGPATVVRGVPGPEGKPIFDSDMPARNAIEVAKGLNNQAEGMPGDNRRLFSSKPGISSKPGNFVEDTARSAPYRTAGKGLLSSMGVSPKTAEALTSENLIVPAIAGIGSMLASMRPTLGGAIGEGLIGGTSAYTALRKQETEEEKAKGPAAVQAASAAKEIAETQRLGLYAIPGFGTFYLIKQNGKMRAVTKDEFETLRKSGADFQQVGQRDVSPEQLKVIDEEVMAKSGKPGTGKPGTGQPEAGKSEAGKPEAGKVTFGYTYDPVIKAMAEEEKRGSATNFSLTDQKKLDFESSQNKIKEINAQASGAAANQMNLIQVLKDANVIATATGPTASGIGASKRIAMLRAMNTIAKIAGQGDNYFGEDVANAGTSEEMLEKARTLNALARAGGVGQKSFEALNQLAAAFPKADMTSDTIATLTASMIVENQKAIDRNAFWQRYKKDSSGFAANFEEAFKRASPQSKYEAEKNFWIRIIKDKQSAAMIKDFSADPNKYAKVYDEDKMRKNKGLGRVSRYFGVTAYGR